MSRSAKPCCITARAGRASCWKGHHRGWRRVFVVAAATSLQYAWQADAAVIYYSMFGFQRVGDLIWAAADQRARAFRCSLPRRVGPRSAARTTTPGRHEPRDHSTIPNCRAYDPAFAELAVILDHGMRQMMERQQGRFLHHRDERNMPALIAGRSRGADHPWHVPLFLDRTEPSMPSTLAETGRDPAPVIAAARC